MSLEEQRRAGFEKWILDNHCGDEDLVLRDNDGDYYSVGVAERWEMYNAALDSIEIELPKVDDPDCGQRVSFHLGAYRSQCRKAIEAAGLKVKR